MKNILSSKITVSDSKKGTILCDLNEGLFPCELKFRKSLQNILYPGNPYESILTSKITVSDSKKGTILCDLNEGLSPCELKFRKSLQNILYPGNPYGKYPNIENNCFRF